MASALQLVLGRLLAAWIAALCIWLAAKYGILIPDDSQVKIVAGTLAVIMALFTTVYSLVHKWLDHHLNPADTAASVLNNAAQAQKRTLSRNP